MFRLKGEVLWNNNFLVSIKWLATTVPLIAYPLFAHRLDPKAGVGRQIGCLYAKLGFKGRRKM